jgi:hypothetical protein
MGGRRYRDPVPSVADLEEAGKHPNETDWSTLKDFGVTDVLRGILAGPNHAIKERQKLNREDAADARDAAARLRGSIERNFLPANEQRQATEYMKARAASSGLRVNDATREFRAPSEVHTPKLEKGYVERSTQRLLRDRAQSVDPEGVLSVRRKNNGG